MRYLAVICLLASSFSLAFAQDAGAMAPRTIQLEPAPLPKDLVVRIPDNLVKIVKLMLDGVEVKPGVPFQAGDNWFDRIRIVIKNVSPKKIVFADGYLRFPETGDATAEHLAAMGRILVGQRPEHARNSFTGMKYNDAPSAPILIAPGQEIAIPVVDDFDRVRATIESRQPLSSVTTCVVGLTTLYFDDGTKWLSGLYFRADPSTPGRYLRISRKEFDAEGVSQ
jgi:hypothetical protein